MNVCHDLNNWPFSAIVSIGEENKEFVQHSLPYYAKRTIAALFDVRYARTPISLVIYCHSNLVEKMIKIIDLFAGPGGLGEGFASYLDEETGEAPFSIVASVEKEANAHETLQLRSFFRKFPRGNAPKEYYQYVRGEGISKGDLFKLYKKESSAAIEETLGMPRTLGLDNELIENKIKEALEGHEGPKIVIGGPPCQAYSLVGRSRNMGNAEYVAENDPRHFLYKEYLKILTLVTPDVFVMENVKGILSSKLDEEYIFPQIIDDLKNPGKALDHANQTEYKVYSLVVPAADPQKPEYKDTRNFIIKAEKFGVAQARHRVILLGVRTDIQNIPSILTPSTQVNIEQVIGDLPMLRSGLSKEEDTLENWLSVLAELHDELIIELDELGMIELSNIVRNSRQNQNENLWRGETFIPTTFDLGEQLPVTLNAWLLDPRLDGVLNHASRGHIRTDLKRYLFCACFAELNNARENPAPKANEFLDSLAPNHKNWKSGKFTDRFRVQASGKFATTITSHISKDGHYFIHYNPQQCRSLTVREAARIQSFPDNYFFEGNRTQQYVQVGNAVPPYLANQIASIVYRFLHEAGMA